MAKLRNRNLGVFIQYQYTRTIILRNKIMGQSLFKRHSKFQNFYETFYYGMTRLRNTDLDGFIPCQYARIILRIKNMRQSLFKKFDEILYDEMTRFRNFKLAVFKQYQNRETIFKKEKYGTESF